MDFVVGNDTFGKTIADGLGCEYREFRKEYYPDGEPSPRILVEYGEVEGKDVLVVWRAKQRSNKEGVVSYLYHFPRIVNNLLEEGLYKANSVDVLMPYFLLARQDHNPKTDPKDYIRERDKGKDIGYKSLAKSFKCSGARRIITFNPHFFRQGGSVDVCGLEVVSLSGIPALGRYAKDKVSEDAIVVSPDFGSSGLGEEFSRVIDRKFVVLNKQRKSGKDIKYSDAIDVDGHEVLMIDDIFSTLNTVNKAIEILRNSQNIDVYGVHAVLPSAGHEKVRELLRSGKIRRLVTTDTINSDYSVASVIPEIIEFYRRN